MSEELHEHDEECDNYTEYSDHKCHFCGDYVCKKGFGSDKKRHWLSDCRPDLVKHEIGEACTWVSQGKPILDQYAEFPCYAYQDRITNEWTREHKHFYQDGPM